MRRGGRKGRRQREKEHLMRQGREEGEERETP